VSGLHEAIDEIADEITPVDPPVELTMRRGRKMRTRRRATLISGAAGAMALIAAAAVGIPALASRPADQGGVTTPASGAPRTVRPVAEPVLDAAGRDAYRRRIRELDADLAAADRAGDAEAAERAEAERQALVSELRRATGLAGRPRRAAAEAERARVNVTRTLRAAIDRIALAAPITGAHLQASIRTGTACRYQPAPGGPASWRV